MFDNLNTYVSGELSWQAPNGALIALDVQALPDQIGVTLRALDSRGFESIFRTADGHSARFERSSGRIVWSTAGFLISRRIRHSPMPVAA